MPVAIRNFAAKSGVMPYITGERIPTSAYGLLGMTWRSKNESYCKKT